MLKVVKITANFPPKKCGIADYTRILCEHTVDAGKDIFFHIITSADQDVIMSGYAHEGIEVLPVIDDWSFKDLAKVKKIIKDLSPDIIHIEYNMTFYRHRIAMNFLSCLLKRENPAYKIIVTFHDLPNLRYDKDIILWLTSLLLLTDSDKIILTNNSDFNDKILGFLSVKEKCVLIPVGSNIARKPSEREKVRRELNIPASTLVVSFFGFIREEKDFEKLFYAFSRLLRSGRDARLLMIGGTLNAKMSSSLEKLSHKLEIAGNVIWTGYQKEERISELLSSSDITVLPYKKGISTNSGALAACILHELPVVATRNRFMPDIIRDGYNFILAAPGAPADLENALFRAADDEGLRGKLSGNMKELNEYFSWQRISEEVAGLYEKLRINIKVSIVICTYGRPEITKTLLAKLDNQRYRNFEVIVVCQGDKNDLERIRDMTDVTYPVKYCYESDPNLPQARNIGIKEAAGEVVLFMDDDTIPDDALLKAHIANYEDPAIGIVGGRILEKRYKKRTPISRIGTVRRFDGFYYSGFQMDVRRRVVMHVAGGNLSVRKKVAMEAGGFDGRFEKTAYFEDMDFCLRVLRKGFKIVFDSRAIIEHLAIPTGGCCTDTREEMIYWLYRSHTLMFLNNFNALFYPIVVVEYIARAIVRSLVWRNPNVIKNAFRGMRDGCKAHFTSPRRLR